ncbi:protein BatD [Paracoccus sp. M683]|uniref:BatD family protein n=1 Tax=Paracoccus sp. M683 TaxID=2594268 RepID=UPI00117FDCD1|nr:BatD family protein [Paracoccus sp. M683]TRW97315.1 protein BatD [Paracoccus sp. M683]
MVNWSLLKYVLIPLAAVLALLVLANRAPAQEMRLQILHPHGNPVVGEMIPLTIRAEYDARVNLSELIFPGSPDYDWLQLTKDDWYRERIKGRQWQIFQRRIAVFAREAGPLTIGPLTHDLTITGEDGRQRRVEVTAPAVTIDIKPFPGGFAPLSAHHLSLTDELSADPGKLREGELLIRRVTLVAEGALPHQLPPRPDIREPWLISFTQPEQRSVRPTPDGPVSTVVWEWSLQPKTGEAAVLKAFAFPWLDTRTRQIEVAPMKPIPFGFASFAANIAADGQVRSRTRLAAVGLLGLGLVAGLALLLPGQGLRPPKAIRRAVMRWRPSPHIRGMRAAAAQGRMLELLAAASAHLALRGHDARQAAVLAPLKGAIYAPGPATETFDAKAFIAAVIRQGRRPPDQIEGDATRWSINKTPPKRTAKRTTTG